MFYPLNYRGIMYARIPSSGLCQVMSLGSLMFGHHPYPRVLVADRGFEPLYLAALVPKTSVYTVPPVGHGAS